MGRWVSIQRRGRDLRSMTNSEHLKDDALAVSDGVSQAIAPSSEADAAPAPVREPVPQNQGKFSRNLLANLVSFALNLGIGLCFTPYLVRHLGVAAYGLVPLTVTLTSYLGLVTLALNAVVGRYLTIEMEKGDVRAANVIFNTSLFGVSALALVVVAIGSVGVVFAPSLIRIPHGYEAQARSLLLFCVGSLLLMELATPFSVSSFCRNRLDIQSSLTSANLILRVLVVVVLFSVTAPKLWHVGVGIALAASFSLVSAVVCWRRLTPQLSVDLHCFDAATLRQLTGTGLWVVVSQLGTMLLLSVDLLIANRLFGPYDSGRYAALLQWSAMLRGIAGTIAVVFAPTMMYYYAREDRDGLVQYSRRSVRILGILIGLPVGLVCGFSRPLLTVWLDSSYGPLAPLLVAMTVHLSISLAYLPLHSISSATNQVRVPGIVQIIAGVVNLGLGIFLAKGLGWGLYGVAIAGGVVLGLRNLVFTPLYAAHILDRPLSTFLGEVLPIATASLLLTALCWWLTTVLAIANWRMLIVCGCSVSVVYVVFVYFRVLAPDERQRISSMLPSRFARTR